MRRFIIIGVALLILFPSPAHAEDFFDSENDDVEDGNELLLEGKTAEALEKYDDAARSLPGRPAVHLNRGLALARSGENQLDQAMQAFQLAGDGSGEDRVSARALSNLGNAFFKKQDFQKAVELYKQSLMLEPGNKDVAWNLELARQKKKEKEEQQKKDQENKDQENQDQENQDQQNQDQQNQDQQNQDQQNQDQQNKDKQDKDEQQDKPEEQKDKKDENKDKSEDQKKEQEQQEKQQEQTEPKTKQQVEQVLDSLDDQQKNLMKQMAKQKGAMLPAGRVKDW